jgi:hypothetical protein
VVDADPRRVAASLVRIGIILGAAVAAVQTVLHLTNTFLYDADVDALNAEVDGNAFAWASSMATLAGAFVALAIAGFDRLRTRRYVLLAALLTFFSMDDVVAIHERLGSVVRSDVLGLPTGFGRLVWPAIFFPLLAAAFFLLWEWRRDAPEPSAWGLRLGLGCLVAAVAAEILSTPWYTSGRSGESVPGALEVVVEEGLEIFAWAVIATALAGVAYARLVSVARTPARG